MTKRPRFEVPDLGVGVGLRVPHYGHVLSKWPPMAFFEIVSENFMLGGGKPRYHLDRAMERYPIVQHGVSLSIGSPEPLDWDYLAKLKALVRHTKTPWLSDHFCWSGAGGAHLHDLLPLPYTNEAVTRIAERARQVQDYLEVPFALENTSSYLTYTSSTMTEWEFVSAVVEEADVGLMFDVNNVYVSAYNHGFDPYEFVRNVPHERIVQIHLAGHTNLGNLIIDTHSGPVIDPVRDLYRETIELAGPVSTLIEWDDEIPAFDRLIEESVSIRALRDSAMAARTTERRVSPWANSAPGPHGAKARYAESEPGRTHANAPSHAPSHTPDRAWIQGGPREVPSEGRA